MTLLYDSKKRKPRAWIFIIFFVIPVLFILVFMQSTKETVVEYKAEKEAAEKEDVFARF